MAERSLDKKTKTRPNSTSKTERSKKVEFRPHVKSASGPTKKHTDDLFAKEEQYKLLNAELEARTAELVREAEQLMKEQNEVLSKPLSKVLLSDAESEEFSSYRIKKSQQNAEQDPRVKMVTRKKVTSTAQHTSGGKQTKFPHNKTENSKKSRTDDLAVSEDEADVFLAKTIRSLEEKMTEPAVQDSVVDDMSTAEDHVGPGVSDAQMRVLKAKLRIMQEELDQLSCEYYKRDDENVKLSAKMKELEEDRARLQRTTNIQQTQIEKHKALAEESAKKCEALQLQVSALQKETENMNRSQKQAAALHGTVEVRLNRALEEVERLKSQLDKTKQMNKDKRSEEHQSKENLLAENKMLKKQKAELIVGFKKQLRLIDILKRQKMHFEAAKLLSFTEEEFMKALDWGKS
ncbi:testis-expressed protein 9 isoform X2 [Kryptolebias marmoratus]|uniref:testis-expressed protein 9 isoform X2 n=1 Tax=Kryptolebias marmoratus TaxID=37003 RepID=UPI0007F8E782|nr:testis-expressed protein 9 isoform X2 [Kryptolebias marmoratus]